MVIALLVIATIADLGLAALLVAVSGFIFGHGPEGMHGNPAATAVWAMMLIITLAAPILGFMQRKQGRERAGLLVAWLPPIGAMVITFATTGLSVLK
jgi:hypothetical protein